jgi:hypothetical protein
LVRFEPFQAGVIDIVLDCILEVGEAPFGHVTKVAFHVHELVIAEQCVVCAAGCRRLYAQLFEEVQDRLLLVAAIELVSRLHDDQLAPDPTVVAVDSARESKRTSCNLEVAMDIPERYDSLRRRACREGQGQSHREGDPSSGDRVGDKRRSAHWGVAPKRVAPQ